MSNLLRRLRKLEGQLTDRRGLMPYTQPWRDHWYAELDKLIAEELIEQKVPFKVLDDLFSMTDSEDAYENATDNEKDSIGSAQEQNLQGRRYKVGVSTVDRIH